MWLYFHSVENNNLVLNINFYIHGICMQHYKHIAKYAKIPKVRMEMTYSSAGGMMLLCVTIIQTIQGLTVICRLKPDASMPHLNFCLREVCSQWYYYSLHQCCRKAEREAKQRSHKRKAPGDSINWATKDTCGVRGGTKLYTTSLHTGDILFCLKNLFVFSDLEQIDYINA